MKRYLLFCGREYYPGGGWNDFVGDFDTIEEARTTLNKQPDLYGRWYQIVDRDTKEKCESDD